MVKLNLKTICNIPLLNDGYMQEIAKKSSTELLVFFFSRYHLMNTCWQEEPMLRPEFLHLRNKLLEFIEKKVMKNVM